MKDARGHGSNPRGGTDAVHQAARKAIMLAPNDPHPEAERVLSAMGYSPNDILRLRAGAAVANTPAAHQTGVNNLSGKDYTYSRLSPVDTAERIKKAAGV